MSTPRDLLSARLHTRYVQYRDLNVVYEGSSEEIPVRPPDLSPGGMFINTSRHYPEGAVLKVSFYLVRRNYEIRTRAEVRFCQPGVGICVEFVEISEEARRALEEELQP